MKLDWSDLLYDSMIETEKQEKAIAIKESKVVADRTLFITLIVDWSWSHRSHGHRYFANLGVACVMGAKTKKLLYLGVRNKYCAMCLYLKKQEQEKVHDHYFKNWLDSSVHKKLRKMVFYSRHLEKIECTNHVMKNYTKALIKRQGPLKNVKDIVLVKLIKRLVKDARAAIIHNSKNGYRLQALNYIQECLKPVVRKSYRLVTNSNYAENLMSFVDKFLGVTGTRKRKQFEIQENEDYGDTCKKLDLDPEELEKRLQEFKKKLQVSKEQRAQLEKNTRGQDDNEVWFTERKFRVTAQRVE
ncbi:hypothetical protein RN001_001882 [Aquatica leii]|uniref:Mutator-like transposase domain-containing protein n=1 Tax=Aquatica leii TaxID=1421715 RepID=A0AAN7PLP2_9COLE|nr:hypothetical protein RN001_001882 [Aquatica leii]